MKQTGYVTEVNKDKIKVRIIRGSACGGHCASCKGCPAEVHTIECDGYTGVKKGDTVELSSDSKKIVNGAAFGYCVPAVTTIAGGILGYSIFKTDGGTIAFTALGVAVGICAVKLFAKKYKIAVKAIKK